MRSYFIAFGVGCLLLPNIVVLAMAQDTAVTVVANQVRSQGFVCSNPKSAERVEAQSLPLQPVYLLKCEDATYEVRIIPNQAATVTKVE
jgi:hypothetical protein